MNLSEQQEKIQEQVMTLLMPYCNEEVCRYTVYYRLKDCDGKQVGEDTCTDPKCIKAEKANIRAYIGKGKHLYEDWYSNDGDHDRIERCCICSTPLNTGLTWIESEFEYYESEYGVETKEDIINSATDIFAIFYSLSWCVDKDETLPERIESFGNKIINLLTVQP